MSFAYDNYIVSFVRRYIYIFYDFLINVSASFSFHGHLSVKVSFSIIRFISF